MKIHIFYDIKTGPWGGGNQLLKGLREYFRQKGMYAELADDADVVLFNSHHFGENYRFLFKLWKLTRFKPDIVVLHRLDGPIFKVRGKGFGVDKIIYSFNEKIADGTIYQSDWSKIQNMTLGLPVKANSTTIMNAPDPEIFYPGAIAKPGGKVKIISTSWSTNPRKGFAVYRYLDKHLDWDRFDMTFVGNSPIPFDRIRHISAVDSKDLATLLRQHHIFLTASQEDPCSNSLIEALHCGLPAVGMDCGGHPEIINGAGELFENEVDVLSVIDRVATSIEFYRKQIDLPSIDKVGKAYYDFAEKVFEARKQRNIADKRFSMFSLFKLIGSFLWYKYRYN